MPSEIVESDGETLGSGAAAESGMDGREATRDCEGRSEWVGEIVFVSLTRQAGGLLGTRDWCSRNRGWEKEKSAQNIARFFGVSESLSLASQFSIVIPFTIWLTIDGRLFDNYKL